MRDVKTRAGERGDFDVAAHADGFRLRREFPSGRGGWTRGPSRITPPAASDGSSQWSITGKPSERQYSITWRINFAVAMGLPSSLTATIPASCIAAISASASPLLPMEAAPMGQTRTCAAAAARSTMERVTDALSFTGCVLGMQQTAVNPPRAAARVPVSMVSEISWPGSRKMAMQIDEAGSDDQAGGVEDFGVGCVDSRPLLRTMRSPSIRTSDAASVPLAGSRMRPPVIRIMRRFLCWVGRVRRRAAHKMEEQSHAHGEAVGDLLENAGLRTVGDGRIDFQAADHWAGMQDDRVGLGAAQALGRELIAQDVFVHRNGRLVDSLGLNAKDHHHIGVFQCFFDPRDAPDIWREAFELFAESTSPGRRE